VAGDDVTQIPNLRASIYQFGRAEALLRSVRGKRELFNSNEPIVGEGRGRETG